MEYEKYTDRSGRERLHVWHGPRFVEVPILDPATNEPTGETETIERPWDEPYLQDEAKFLATYPHRIDPTRPNDVPFVETKGDRIHKAMQGRGLGEHPAVIARKVEDLAHQVEALTAAVKALGGDVPDFAGGTMAWAEDRRQKRDAINAAPAEPSPDPLSP